MGKRIHPHPKPQPLALHLKAWRLHRKLSQEQLAERIGTTAATISRIETRKQNWDQEFLRLAGEALSCAPADLMMRDPTDIDHLWSIYDQLPPAQRIQAVAIIRALKDTGTGG